MKVINLDQRSTRWKEWRSEGVTASDVPIILGLSPYKTPWMLWAEKTGRINPPDISRNPNVRRGIRLEDTIRQVAEQRYNDILLPLCGEYDEWNVLRASFDGLCSKNKPYEFKAPGDQVWDGVQPELVDDSSDSIWNELFDTSAVESIHFKMYEAQVQAQSIVSGSDNGRLIFYREDGQDVDFEILLTDKRKDEIIQAAKEFWQHVIDRNPPPIDPSRDWFIPGKDDQFKWNGYADAWRMHHSRIQTLKGELEALTLEQKAIQEHLIAQMGPYMHSDFAGVKVTRFTKSGAIDYKKFLAEKYPGQDFSSELEKYRKQSSESSRFSRSEDELVIRDVNDLDIESQPAFYF